MRNLAIIPARSGSKGIRDKNIKLLRGKPLMAYSIEAARKSGMFDKIMVSTDSQAYADIAAAHGAGVPFLRSPEASTDEAASWMLVEEVLRGYEEMGIIFDTVCLLQPTSPLRKPQDIVSAYAVFMEKAGTAVVSVCPAEHSPLWCGQIDASGGLDGFISVENIKNRQESGQFYRLNGAIYIWNVNEFRKNQYLFREGSYAYIMDDRASIDIDTALDFEIAEFLMGGGLRRRLDSSSYLCCVPPYNRRCA